MLMTTFRRPRTFHKLALSFSLIMMVPIDCLTLNSSSMNTESKQEEKKSSGRNLNWQKENNQFETKTSCTENEDCRKIENSFCNFGSKECECKPDFPVTGSKHCYKESKYEEFCQLDIQCQSTDKNTRCNKDFNLCECQPRYSPKFISKVQSYFCMENTIVTDTSVGSYVNPTLFGIMGGLALMFIVMCVVLRLFAKAQFTDTRTIFNTPNPRLMNVSLMQEKRGPNTSDEPSRSSKKRSGTIRCSGGRHASSQEMNPPGTSTTDNGQEMDVEMRIIEEDPLQK